MSPEQKDLLKKVICEMLPYGVKATTTSNGWNGIYTITGYNNDRIYLDCPIYDEGDDEWLVESVKPYLRPMQTMTDGEFRFLQEHLPYDFARIYSGKFDLINDNHLGNSISIDDMAFLLECLNKWHLDYYGLIPMGLALEAPEGMYKMYYINDMCIHCTTEYTCELSYFTCDGTGCCDYECCDNEVK